MFGCQTCKYTFGGTACGIFRGVVAHLLFAMDLVCGSLINAFLAQDMGSTKVQSSVVPGTFSKHIIQTPVNTNPLEWWSKGIVEETYKIALKDAKLAFYTSKSASVTAKTATTAGKFWIQAKSASAAAKSVYSSVRTYQRTASRAATTSKCFEFIIARALPMCAPSLKFAPVCVMAVNALAGAICAALTELLAMLCAYVATFIIEQAHLDDITFNQCMNTVCARCGEDGCFGDTSEAFFDNFDIEDTVIPPETVVV